MKKLFYAMTACAALLFVGCIDRGFDLADVSGEVTVGGEELVVPLATVDDIYLGNIIKGNDALTNDDNGVYQISFADGGSVEVAGVEIPAIRDLSPEIAPVKFDVATIPTTYTIENIQQQLELEVPSLTDLVRIDAIDIAQEIALPDWLKPYLNGTASLSDAIASRLPLLDSSIDEPITSSFNASIKMVEGVSAVDHVLFGNDEFKGAEFSIEMDLGGIADITGSGTLNFELVFPEGYYFGHYVDKDIDGDGKKPDYQSFDQATHNIIKDQIILQKGKRTISKKVYLERINYDNHSIGADGMLNINDAISCDYDLKIKLCGGEVDVMNYGLPKLHVKAVPVYKDIEVVIGDFQLDHVKHEFKHEFTGIPKQVDAKKLAFDQSSVMTLYMTGLDWLTVYDNETREPFSPYMEIILPPCMHFRKDDHGEVHIENNVIRASLADLKSGVNISLDYIDCLDSSIKRDVDKLILDSAIESIVHMESLQNHKVFVSDLMPDANPVKVELGMTNMMFNVDMNRSEVEWGEDMELNLDLKDQMPSLSQEIAIPSMIASIESIEIGKEGSENEPMSIRFELGTEDNKAFPVGELELDVLVNLGTLLRPTQRSLDLGVISINEKGEKLLTIKRTWLPNSGKLSEVVEFEALENLPAVIDGKLKIDQEIVVERCIATIKGGQEVNLEAINDVAIDMNIAIDNIEARKFRGGVNISVAPEEMVVELGLPELGVEIGALSINPILKLNLEENPTGVPLFANVELKTLGAEGEELTNINISNVEIKGLGATNIVLSTAKNRGKFKGENITFVEVNELSQLLSKGLPAKIAVKMLVATDKTQIYEIDLLRAKQGYNIKYDYDALIPLDLDDVNISYETVITGLNETFASLAKSGNSLKVGDIGILAEFGTTIPFNINLFAELVNKDGTTDDVEATLKISNNGQIDGWAESDGNRVHVSKLDFEFKLGESKSLECLANVDGIRLVFSLTNVKEGESAALMDTQYLNGVLKLRVRDGLSIDIFDLIGKEE